MNKSWFEWLDDKTQVIIATFIISILVIAFMPETASNHIDAIITGMFGVAIGTKLR